MLATNAWHYSVALREDLRYLGGAVADVRQPPDTRLLWFASGCCAPSRHVALVLFDRTLHEIPAELEDIPISIGDGPWRGRELIVRRKADDALVAFDPRTGATRTLGLKLSGTEAIWGISGDYLALGRRIVELKAGAATTAVMTASGAFAPLQAAAGAPGPGTPTPVVGDPAFGGLHINGVGIGIEPSPITDFNGAVGAAIVDGTGVGTNASGATESLLFDTDMRFMQGVFRGTDGRVHEGTFAFV